MRLIDWLQEQYPSDSPTGKVTWQQAIALTDPRVFRRFMSRPKIVVESFDVMPMDAKATRTLSGLLFGQGR